MTLDAQIESLLFWKDEPMSLKKMADILNVSEEEIKNNLDILDKKLYESQRGISVVYKEQEVMLTTHKEMSAVIEKLIKEELVKNLGKAGLETLSIVLYKSPISRRDIDYIRGVNSNFILRNLLVRGLVEKVQASNDQRSFLYKPTFELLSYLGISKLEELPEYESVRLEMNNIHE